MGRRRQRSDELRGAGRSSALDGWVLAGPDGVLADRLEEAADRRARARGLLGRARLPAGEALLIRRCRQVHTFRMQFPIDVVFCDRDLRVLYVRTIAPGRLSRIVPRARYCFELPAGRARTCGVTEGSQLTFESPA